MLEQSRSLPPNALPHGHALRRVLAVGDLYRQSTAYGSCGNQAACDAATLTPKEKRRESLSLAGNRPIYYLGILGCSCRESRMDRVVRATRWATGKPKTREQMCGEVELPVAVRECIAQHDGKEPSPHIAVAPITDPTNPAYRANGHVNGRAEMCVAKHDLDEGACLGCYPGSGRQWQRQIESPAADPFSDGYCIMLRDNRGFITPGQADQNPLSRSNDYRTNIDDPTGPQDRKPNGAYAEIWQGGLPYIVFFTTRATRKGEEITWDYGQGYWGDAEMRRFRSLPLHEQADKWDEFMDGFEVTKMTEHVRTVVFSETLRVLVAGIIWATLMATKQETLAALLVSVCALFYGVVLARKHRDRLSWRQSRRHQQLDSDGHEAVDESSTH